MDKLLILAEHYPNIAYFYALFGNIALAIMQIYFKIGSAYLTPFQLLTIRSICLLLISLMMLRRQSKSPYINSPQIFYLVITRMVLTGCSTSVMYYCLKYIPISLGVTLFNTGPLFIFFIESFYYKKPIQLANLCLTFFSFVGVILVIQPEFIFGKHSFKPVENIEFYSALMLIAAFGHALNMHFIHSLAKHIQPLVNMHYSHVGFIMTGSILSNFQPATIEPENVNIKTVFIIMALVLTGFVTQYLIVLANSLRKPSHMMPFGYAGVATGFLADIFFFKTEFTLLAIIGIFLTSVGLFSEYLISRDNKEVVTINSLQLMARQNDDVLSDFNAEETRQK